MKATEQYFPVVLFIVLYKVVLTFESVDEILKCGYSDESYQAALFPAVLHSCPIHPERVESSKVISIRLR